MADSSQRQQWQLQLQKRCQWTARSRLQKLMRVPWHTVYTHGLAALTHRLNRVVTRRIRTFWGEEMRVVLPDGISHFLFCNHFFEEDTSSWLLHYLKPGDRFVDVGAHFGYFSLLASALVGSEGIVDAFEPTPSTFEILQLNCGARPNIHLHRSAAWSERTTLRFRDFGVRYSGLNTVGEPRWDQQTTPPQGNELKVPALPLDNYFQGDKKPPNLIKIDAEGAELQVLTGLQKTIRENRPILLMEVGDLGPGRESPTLQLLEPILRQGYRPMEFSNGVTEPHELPTRYQPGNLLFLPESR